MAGEAAVVTVLAARPGRATVNVCDPFRSDLNR